MTLQETDIPEAPKNYVVPVSENNLYVKAVADQLKYEILIRKDLEDINNFLKSE